eukprot:SAG11_NODE_1188_length_5587_cov_3.059402_4_plen_65_part_00
MMRCSRREAEYDEEEYRSHFCYLFELGAGGLVVDASRIGNVTRYMNYAPCQTVSRPASPLLCVA